MNAKNQNQLKKQLEQYLRLFEKSVRVLEHSYTKCKRIKFRKNISADDLEALDALASRFARASDIFTQNS